jgi:hypothetical protein
MQPKGSKDPFLHFCTFLVIFARHITFTTHNPTHQTTLNKIDTMNKIFLAVVCAVAALSGAEAKKKKKGYVKS